MSQIQTNNEIIQLRRDLKNLKEVVENLTILLNKKMLKELYEEVGNIEKGEYYTEEKFIERHKNLNSSISLRNPFLK